MHSKRCDATVKEWAGAISIGLVLASAGRAWADFVDITTPPLNSSNSNIGSGWGDYDGDGDLDIAIACFNGTAPLVLLHRNDGNGQFAAATASLGATTIRAGGVSFGDSDEDGDLDLAASGVGVGGQSYLFRNNGGGSFNNVSTPAFVGTGGRSIPWVDYDGDGDTDLYVVDTSSSNLLRNDGSNAFVDVTPALLNVSSQTGSWGDYDNDGDQDVYIGFSTGTLARNDGGGSFVDVSAAAGVQVATFKISTAWVDYNNDGHLDLHAGASGDPSALFRNNGNGTFSNVASGLLLETHSKASGTWFDFDNDGDQDLYQCSYLGGAVPSRLLRNDGSDTFVDVATGPLTNSFTDGAPAGDFDLDGDLDLFISAEGAADRLLRNDLAGSNHWLHMNLEGTFSNRRAIGARVTLVAGGITQIREIAGGQGWADQSSLTVEFGLGAATAVTSLSVRWPSGIVQDVPVSGIDRVITVTEPGLVTVNSGFTPGQAFDLVLDAPEVDFDSADLDFRAAGSNGSFSTTTMTIANDQLTGAVTGVAASENGVEYFVSYRLNGGTARAFPLTGAARPAFLPANLGDRSQPAPALANEYVLFSVPLVPGSANLAGVLEDDLGAYDNTKWRFGRFVPSSETYLEAGSAGAISPGRGFWLIERNPVVIDASGTSTNTVGGASLPVDPGWNQIGHPYLFTVPTSAVDFANAPNVTNRFVGREGGAYVDQTTLEPWKGYWVFNAGTGTQTIVIPGVVGLPPAPRALSLSETLDWAIEARAHARGSSDIGNIAGAISSGDAVALTLAEPPGLPGTVRVYFTDRETWSETTTSVRTAGDDPASFELTVESGSEPATLSFAGLETLPSGRSAVLVHDETLALVELDGVTTLPIRANSSVRFRLAVGSDEGLASIRNGTDAPGSETVLAAARPNPFSGETTIAFAIPSAQHVQLSIYDVTGRLVRTLASGQENAGIHRVTWNGTDDGATRIAPGVYFAKLRAGSQERIEKLVLLK